MNDELCINGSICLSIDRIMRKITKEKNLHITKICFKHFDDSCISAVLGLIPHLHLEILSIRRSTICADDACAIVNYIANHELTKLELIKCACEHGALINIINSISGSSLKKINLDRYDVGMNEAEAIVGFMRASLLFELAFVSCTFQKDALPFILSAIKTSAVQSLILEYTVFDIESTIAIMDTINDCNLIKLSLHRSSLEIANNEATQKKMVDTIHNSSLHNLNVDGTLFHCPGGYKFFFRNVEEIIKLINHSKIEKFSLGDNSFGLASTIAIMDAITQNASLKHIYFFINFNSDYFCDKVCDMIENSPATKLILNLRTQGFTRANKIIASIKKSSIVSLKLMFDQLNLNLFNIRDLIESHTLIKLDLQCNNMSDAMLRAIFPSIKGSSLVKFNCCNKSINKDTLKEMKNIMCVQRQIANRFQTTKSAMARS